ncbi:hypothetical protein BCR44DRAFT_1480132 [Catenaria anguillulae PL171]|uniref:Uncharacterized protein n=1 Tax=Catenaria anguillulae PL171 TaxID=765915 RepID=A0A1Y2HI95_9FUNG|nr:hypothetical protein BCR44DRAFT_1480132 [Catenaria anguillulae PL171]
MELPFTTVDVFTRTRFRGNPLAVVTIPANLALSYDQKLNVAREFNLSETVFIHAPASGSGSDSDSDSASSRDIDIFLTTREIPFAGHPTIGAAITLLSQGVTTLNTKAGPIQIVRTAQDAVRASIPFNTHLHKLTLADLAGDSGSGGVNGQDGSTASPQPWLSSDPAIRKLELTAPVFSIVKGMTFVLIELPDLDTLARVKPATEMVPEHVCDPEWQGGFVSKYYYVKTSRVQSGSGPTRQSIRTRMMEPAFEDPATGSAACALASFLVLQAEEFNKSDAEVSFEVTQGVEMGKESNIEVLVGVVGGELKSVQLAGAAVPVMRGTITV